MPKLVSVTYHTMNANTTPPQSASVYASEAVPAVKTVTLQDGGYAWNDTADGWLRVWGKYNDQTRTVIIPVRFRALAGGQ